MQIDLAALAAAGSMIKEIGATACGQLDLAYPDSAAAAGAHPGFAATEAMDQCEQVWRDRCRVDAYAITNAGQSVIASTTNYTNSDDQAARRLYGPGR